MTAPTNNTFLTLLALETVITPNQMLETRIENDGDGNPIYIGITNKANALTSEKVFFIVKCTYVGGFLTYKQLPNNGLGLIYSWDDRATYF